MAWYRHYLNLCLSQIYVILWCDYVNKYGVLASSQFPCKPTWPCLPRYVTFAKFNLDLEYIESYISYCVVWKQCLHTVWCYNMVTWPHNVSCILRFRPCFSQYIFYIVSLCLHRITLYERKIWRNIFLFLTESWQTETIRQKYQLPTIHCRLLSALTK